MNCKCELVVNMKRNKKIEIKVSSQLMSLYRGYSHCLPTNPVK